ncbi:MAG TPA: translation initiation factor IF-3 [Acidimicrobiales bacterium]|nr:translation initiation factor IF-3 [Acidimicrobiales bacterium]
MATANEHRINDRIRAREVRLISQDGQQVGIVPLPDALKMAQENDLDLVEVAPLATPPVCRIMDFRKWQYEEKQRAKESKRKASNVSVKEMKYRPKIGVGDFDTKTRKVAEFLTEGHKVKVTIMFRGREVFHPELGARILDHIAEDVAEVGKVETQGRLDGRNMTMVLAPEKKKSTARKQGDRATALDEASASDGGVVETAGVTAAAPAPTPAAVSTETPTA